MSCPYCRANSTRGCRKSSLIVTQIDKGSTGEWHGARSIFRILRTFQSIMEGRRASRLQSRRQTLKIMTGGHCSSTIPKWRTREPRGGSASCIRAACRYKHSETRQGKTRIYIQFDDRRKQSRHSVQKDTTSPAREGYQRLCSENPIRLPVQHPKQNQITEWVQTTENQSTTNRVFAYIVS